jgi:hypothetical protein
VLGGANERATVVAVSALTMMWKSPLIDDGSVNVVWLVYDSPGLRKRGLP